MLATMAKVLINPGRHSKLCFISRGLGHTPTPHRRDWQARLPSVMGAQPGAADSRNRAKNGAVLVSSVPVLFFIIPFIWLAERAF